MNGICFDFTDLTLSLRQSPRFGFRRPPSAAPRMIVPPRPSRVVFPTVVFGLPCSHTVVTAKRLFGMEVSRRPLNILTAPFTYFCNGIGSAWIRLSYFPFLPTFKRTVDLISFPGAYRGFTTDRAYRMLLFIAPSIFKVAGRGAKGLIVTAIMRMKISSALNALCCKAHVSHVFIISTIVRMSRKIEEKYCEIAVRRLQQEVLPL